MGQFLITMLGFGYKQSNADHTMFIKHNGDMIIVLIVYVDDIVVIGNDVKEMFHLKLHWARQFEIKDLGPLKD